MKYCVLITDMSHFVAQATAVALLKNNYRVIGLVEDESYVKSLKELLSRHIKDLSQLKITHLVDDTKKTKDTLLKDIDIIFHLLPQPPILSEYGRLFWLKKYHKDTLEWLNLSEKNNIRRFVCTASIMALRYNMKKPTMHLIDGQNIVEPQWDTLPPFASQVIKSDISNWQYVWANKLDNIFTAIYLPSPLGNFKGYSLTPFISIMEKIIDGQISFIPKLAWPGIDIEDIVNAHLKVLESDVLSNKRLILANDNITIKSVLNMIIDEYPYLKKNMPRVIPSFIFENIFKQFSPSHKIILEELGGTICSNNKFTRELLQTSFIPTEVAMRKTIRNLMD